ncbi:hypothetical protein [Streptomyces virginiae]|uniref:hypothetical protein n=1 Tax=Streptomyces virginiae TaxID=1961 RepID=UPI00225383C9|nr:hypothetical protein [Streptomyces virginiae]MCX5278219.1 hypothetical protein [Streptomyces virginiae]
MMSNTTDGWRRRRLPDTRAQGPRTPIDPAKIGRSSVRRRARGMTHREAFQALADAQIEAHLDRRYEEAADHSSRRAAELAEWERIAQLVFRAGGPYDPDDDAVVQEELAAEAAAAEAREAEQRAAARVAARADQLQALRERGTLEQTEPREGDEAALDELTRRAGSYVQPDVDAWLARALAAHRGHYADPAARDAAAGLLHPPVLAHAALLAALTQLVPGADVDQLPFAARLAAADSEAVGELAAFLTRALTAGSPV